MYPSPLFKVLNINNVKITLLFVYSKQKTINLRPKANPAKTNPKPFKQHEKTHLFRNVLHPILQPTPKQLQQRY